MATVFWIGNAQNTPQMVTLTITAVNSGDTFTVTINTKVVTYTCLPADTTATATSGLYALLVAAATLYPEFGELAYANPTTTTITITASVAGTPFAGMTGGLVAAATGGAAITQTTTTANSSQSDVSDADNWLRAGVRAIPVNGDDVVIANSTVPLLWNLTALAAVQFATYTRWQSFTGTIGLPENNPNGYYEYRPTYFQFIGPPAGTLTMTLGQGADGGGPSRERYDVLTQRTSLIVLASGGAQDIYAIRFLGTNANNTLSVVGTSVGVAMLSAEVSTIASASVDGGGSLDLGPGVTFSGALTAISAALNIFCAPATVDVQSSTSLIVSSNSLTYASVSASDGSNIAWVSNSTITTLTLKTSSTLSKEDDLRAMTITNSTIDGDTCQILDPNNKITYTNATTINNIVQTGPFVFGPGRTVKVT